MIPSSRRSKGIPGVFALGDADVVPLRPTLYEYRTALDRSLFKPLIARALDSAKRCGHREEWGSDKISPSSQTLSDLLQHRPI